MPSPSCARAQSSSAPSGRGLGRDRPVDVLRLAAGAVQRHHEPARDRGGDLGAVIGGDEVQAEVDPGGGAGGGVDAAVDDVERGGVDVDAREAARAAVGVNQCVVARRPSSSPAAAEHERARAERDDRAPRSWAARSAAHSAADGSCVGVRPAGHDDGVGARSSARPCGVSRWKPVCVRTGVVAGGDERGTRTRGRRCRCGRSRRPRTGSRGRRSARPGRSRRRRCACPKTSEGRPRDIAAARGTIAPCACAASCSLPARARRRPRRGVAARRAATAPELPGRDRRPAPPPATTGRR